MLLLAGCPGDGADSGGAAGSAAAGSAPTGLLVLHALGTSGVDPFAYLSFERYAPSSSGEISAVAALIEQVTGDATGAAIAPGGCAKLSTTPSALPAGLPKALDFGPTIALLDSMGQSRFSLASTANDGFYQFSGKGDLFGFDGRVGFPPGALEKETRLSFTMPPRYVVNGGSAVAADSEALTIPLEPQAPEGSDFVVRFQSRGIQCKPTVQQESGLRTALRIIHANIAGDVGKLGTEQSMEVNVIPPRAKLPLQQDTVIARPWVTVPGRYVY